MALFNRGLLKSVVLIEREAGANQYESHATGFLIAFMSDKDEKNRFERI